ncbi:MAG TPA: hypothetical protein VGL56_20810 [Fimbriimonadaceae bacterium]|jgi:hypothetical protein
MVCDYKSWQKLLGGPFCIVLASIPITIFMRHLLGSLPPVDDPLFMPGMVISGLVFGCGGVWGLLSGLFERITVNGTSVTQQNFLGRTIVKTSLENVILGSFGTGKYSRSSRRFWVKTTDGVLRWDETISSNDELVELMKKASDNPTGKQWT